MTALPCPMGEGHQPLRHPDAMFCIECAHRLPQKMRRAIRRANQGQDDREAVLQRCRAWLARRDAGLLVESPRPRSHVRYSTST